MKQNLSYFTFNISSKKQNCLLESIDISENEEQEKDNLASSDDGSGKLFRS